MKFDFCIGNPPYQVEMEGENETYMQPIYDRFIDASYDVADKVELIHPARFLSNAGATPKQWNEKMLSDNHFKVLKYEASSKNIFPNTDIKGGVAITYHDITKEFEPIRIFISDDSLRRVYNKLWKNKEISSFESIVHLQMGFNLKKLYELYPQSEQLIGDPGKNRRLRSNIFSQMPEVFTEKKKSEDDVKILGVISNKRCYRYVNRAVLDDIDNYLDMYKVIVPASNGSGAIGEVLSTPLIGTPLIGTTQTFIVIGGFETELEANACLKYVKTKLARVMLGILKVTQGNPPEKWHFVPMQDFTDKSDIDWTKSVHEIDLQLYKKYGLSDDEIEFIETHVKEME